MIYCKTEPPDKDSNVLADEIKSQFKYDEKLKKWV